MMSLNSLDEPRQLVQQTIATLSPAADIEVIHNIGDIAAGTEEIRAKQREELRDILRSLSRKLEVAKTNASRPEKQPNETLHAEKMVELDKEKFLLKRDIADLEETKEYPFFKSHLEVLKMELSSVDEQLKQELPVDSNVVLLRLYRALGVTLYPDQQGQSQKAVIRSQNNNDAAVIQLNDNKYSPFYTTNFIWEMSM
ncbi:Spc24 subunit of Ndc80-domain-containing protein [Paraphysoderma sedebokerense]|nr:Spc24 subunit of Ndc80-domain-containing protein [Paraphysoderma sedebokerense]